MSNADFELLILRTDCGDYLATAENSRHNVRKEYGDYAYIPSSEIGLAQVRMEFPATRRPIGCCAPPTRTPNWPHGKPWLSPAHRSGTSDAYARRSEV